MSFPFFELLEDQNLIYSLKSSLRDFQQIKKLLKTIFFAIFVPINPRNKSGSN